MNKLLRKVARNLTAEWHHGRKYHVAGLERDKPSTTHLQLGFSLGGYVPKNKVKLIKTYSTKNQAYNTCTQESCALQSECRSKKKLSEQSLTILAKEAGQITEDGFATLTGIQEVVRKQGICDWELLHEEDQTQTFESYSDARKLTPAMRANAATNKSKNWALVRGRAATLQALDNDEVLHTGLDWFTEYNMGYGFSHPWLILQRGKVQNGPISKLTGVVTNYSILDTVISFFKHSFKRFLGWLAGGHAVGEVGYVMGYLGIDPATKKIITGADGIDVYALKNSYGESWGATVRDDDGDEYNGIFFVAMDYFDADGYSRIQQFALTVENLGELLKPYEGKFVKGKQTGIYKIEDGKKRAFPDKITYYAFDGRYGADGNTAVPISDTLLSAVPEGDDMKIEDSPYWPFLEAQFPFIRTLVEPANLQRIKTIIDQEKSTESYYQNNGVTTPPVSFITKLKSLFK